LCNHKILSLAKAVKSNKRTVFGGGCTAVGLPAAEFIPQSGTAPELSPIRAHFIWLRALFRSLTRIL
jgi:hypothetical protein